MDNATLYLSLLRAMLENKNPDHGRQGYYLASSGRVVWDDLYAAMAVALAKRNVVKTGTVGFADDATLEKIAASLGTSPAELGMYLAGNCTYTAKHGMKIGWKPQFSAEHAVEAADEEVERILQNL